MHFGKKAWNYHRDSQIEPEQRERSHVKINSSAIVPREHHTLPLILRLSQFVRRERLDFHFPKPRGKKRDRSDVLKKSMMISSDAYFKTVFVCRMIKRKSKCIDWFSKAALANVRIHFMADTSWLIVHTSFYYTRMREWKARETSGRLFHVQSAKEEKNTRHGTHFDLLPFILVLQPKKVVK